MLDTQIFGPKASGAHLTNAVIHSANAALLFYVLLLMTGGLWQSAFVAALFAAHPLHVESVAWVSERKDVLSAFFWMFTMLFYFRYVNASKVQSLRSRVLFYCATLVFFALGLMSKPMLVTLPFVLLLLDYSAARKKCGGLSGECGERQGKWRISNVEATVAATTSKQNQRRQSVPPLPKGEGRGEGKGKNRTPANVPVETWPKLIIEKLPFLALAVISSVVTFLVQRKGGAVSTLNALPIGARIANTFVSYLRYVGKIFWPDDLSVLYPHPGSWPVALIVASVVFVVGVSVAMIIAGRARPYLAVGWFWFLGTLVPVIGLVAGRRAIHGGPLYLCSGHRDLSSLHGARASCCRDEREARRCWAFLAGSRWLHASGLRCGKSNIGKMERRFFAMSWG